ncbi:MAG: hypothetical protein ABI068_00705 [Ktedonobacterales bacterium]
MSKSDETITDTVGSDSNKSIKGNQGNDTAQASEETPACAATSNAALDGANDIHSVNTSVSDTVNSTVYDAPDMPITASSKTRRPANVQLRRFVSRVITPVVLVVGLLILAFYQFNGVLKVTTANDNAFHGVVTYNNGPMQVNFLQNAGTSRPSVNYKGWNLVTYAEWNSTIAVNGDVQELWNSYHGYNLDDQKRVIVSTASSGAWQVVQVITVVNDHTVTIAYDFVVRPQGNAPLPQHIELSIMHLHNVWNQPTVTGDTFQAQITAPINSANPGAGSRAVGTVTLALSGPALAPHPLNLLDYRNTVTPNGQNHGMATALTSNYVLDNPVANALITLGVETISFSIAVS